MTGRTVVYEFGEFRLDPVARVFTGRDRPIALPPESFDLLMLLVERRGRVLERSELIRELWPDAVVEEANVTFQVSTLRKALGEDGSKWTTSPALDSLASWSRDGRFIYFGSNRDGQVQVWKVPASGEEPGNAQRVTRGGGFAAIESTNGRHVYFTKRASGTPDPRNALWRIPVEGGGDEEVVVDAWRSSHGNWDLTADGLYYVDEEPSPSGPSWVVHFKGFDGRPATVVARLRYTPFFSGPAISVSRDGRWLLSTQSQEDSDLMLVEKFR